MFSWTEDREILYPKNSENSVNRVVHALTLLVEHGGWEVSDDARIMRYAICNTDRQLTLSELSWIFLAVAKIIAGNKLEDRGESIAEYVYKSHTGKSYR